MKVFFDTSVLVAAFYGDHVHHAASLTAFVRCDKATGCCGAHSLAELYSAMTRMPGRHRVSGEQAIFFLKEVAKRLSLITLTGDEYFEALAGAAEQNILGGTVYDALLAYCAVKARVEAIYTWNERHYAQCGLDVTGLLRRPQ